LIRASVHGGLWVAANGDIKSQSAEPICKMASLDRAKLAAEFQMLRPPQDERKRSMAKYLEVLTPQNCQVIFIDQQPQMAFCVQSIDRQTLKNNVVGLAKAAKVFGIPTIVSHSVV